MASDHRFDSGSEGIWLGSTPGVGADRRPGRGGFQKLAEPPLLRRAELHPQPLEEALAAGGIAEHLRIGHKHDRGKHLRPAPLQIYSAQLVPWHKVVVAGLQAELQVGPFVADPLRSHVLRCKQFAIPGLAVLRQGGLQPRQLEILRLVAVQPARVVELGDVPLRPSPATNSTFLPAPSPRCPSRLLRSDCRSLK